MTDIPKFVIAGSVIGVVKAFNLQNMIINDFRDVAWEALYNAGIQKIKDPAPIKSKFEQSTLAAGRVEPDKALYNSSLGTPVFADLTLKGGKYTDNISGKEVTYPEIRLETVVLTVNFTSREIGRAHV